MEPTNFFILRSSTKNLIFKTLKKLFLMRIKTKKNKLNKKLIPYKKKDIFKSKLLNQTSIIKWKMNRY